MAILELRRAASAICSDSSSRFFQNQMRIAIFEPVHPVPACADHSLRLLLSTLQYHDVSDTDASQTCWWVTSVTSYILDDGKSIDSERHFTHRAPSLALVS